jgi:hypothetical protein
MIRRTIKLAGSCDNGPCPAIHDTEHDESDRWPDGLVAVQGYIQSAEELAAMGLPEGETVVLVDRPTLDGWAPGS